jgi:hypothetical protein
MPISGRLKALRAGLDLGLELLPLGLSQLPRGFEGIKDKAEIDKKRIEVVA